MTPTAASPVMCWARCWASLREDPWSRRPVPRSGAAPSSAAWDWSWARSPSEDLWFWSWKISTGWTQPARRSWRRCLPRCRDGVSWCSPPQRPGWSAPWSELGLDRAVGPPPACGRRRGSAGGSGAGRRAALPAARGAPAGAGRGQPLLRGGAGALPAGDRGTGGSERERCGSLPGVAERLPATLTEVLLARLDRLEQQVKGVAQVGSVIGRSFAVRLLARVMEREETPLDGPLRPCSRQRSPSRTAEGIPSTSSGT